MTAYEGDKFGGATSSWIGRLGNLRNVVRQELIRRRHAVPADPDELAALLDAEDALCRTDPYRRVATLFHVIARRPH